MVRWVMEHGITTGQSREIVSNQVVYSGRPHQPDLVRYHRIVVLFCIPCLCLELMIFY